MRYIVVILIVSLIFLSGCGAHHAQTDQMYSAEEVSIETVNTEIDTEADADEKAETDTKQKSIYRQLMQDAVIILDLFLFWP